MNEAIQWIERGEDHYAAGALDAARAAFEQAVTLDPTLPRAWNDLGATHHALGAHLEARTAFSRALDVAPDDDDALLNLVHVLRESDQPEEAVEHLRQRLTRRPDDPVARSLLPALGVGESLPAGVLCLDWDRRLGRLRPALRTALGSRGVPTWTLGRDLVTALAGHWALALDAAVERLCTMIDPCAVLVDAGQAEVSDLFAAASRGVPMLCVGEDGDALAVDHDVIDVSLDAAGLDVWAEAFVATRPAREACGRMDDSPPLAIIIPTYERRRCLQNLLDRLALQDLHPSLFHVIVVDDGSTVPVTQWVDAGSYHFALTLLVQENAGPAAARNLALEHVRSPYVLIYNDDAIPARDNVRRHLLGQLGAPSPEAILGSFDFDAAACQDPFTDLMQHSCLLFEYRAMTPGALHGARFFYTCNISLPMAALKSVGGFDPAFRHAICEDSELGVRLEKEAGLKVRYDPRIRARHDHDMDLPRYRKRARLLGRYRVLMASLHPESVRPYMGKDASGLTQASWLAIRRFEERARVRAAAAAEELEALLTEAATHASGTEERRRILKETERRLVFLVGYDAVVGMLETRPEWTADRPQPKGTGTTTSIIIPNLNGFPHVRGALSTLAAHTDGAVELIVVDNGSTDGSLEWLRSQPGVTLLEMGENIGAPAARNAGLQVASGETVVFCDNDVLFTPRWREICIQHLDAWADVGIVGPMSDYVSGSQKTEERETPDEDLDAFARRFTATHQGDHDYTNRLILFFMMCRRELLDRIGGIDPIFGRWGFEDDDFCLRALRAGYQLRVARDCFIRHLGSRTARTAGLDYGALLTENWLIFKRKWGLPADLVYGSSWDVASIADAPFTDDLHVPFTAGVPRGLAATR